MAKQERLREAKQHGAAWFPFNIYPCTIPKDFPQVALHWQDSMELVFVKKGRGIVQAGLTTYTAQAGDIYVFAPGVLHALRQLPGEALQRSAIKMTACGVECDARPACMLTAEEITVHFHPFGPHGYAAGCLNQRLPGRLFGPKQFTYPFKYARCQPLHARVIQPWLAVQFAGRTDVATEQRRVDLRTAHHQDLPCSRGEDGFIRRGTCTKQRKLGIVSGGNHRDTGGEVKTFGPSLLNTSQPTRRTPISSARFFLEKKKKNNK